MIPAASWRRHAGIDLTGTERQVHCNMRKHYVVQLDKTKDRARCRQWQLRVDSLKMTPSGATSWTTRKVSGVTWTQANEMCDRWAADLDEGRAVVPSRKWTFCEYREHWIECCRAEGLYATGTLGAREDQLAVAGRYLDGYRLDEITASAINSALAAMKRGESPSGRELSGSYMRCIVTAVRLMLEHARKAGEIASNPAADVATPKIDTPEKRPLSMAETKALESALDPADWRHRAVILLAETGMRQCEVLPPNPMLWGAWDERAGLLRVTGSKNENGLRLVPVNRTLAEMLTLARFHVQLALGVDDVSDYAILCDDGGRARGYDALSDWWRSRRASFGLDWVGLHQLRHAMVTDLLANGATLKEAQGIIGDKTGSIVLGVYAHASFEERAEAMRALDEARRVQNLYKKTGSGYGTNDILGS